jgi:metal-sulfur cluster biosynthetic enzyme
VELNDARESGATLDPQRGGMTDDTDSQRMAAEGEAGAAGADHAQGDHDDRGDGPERHTGAPRVGDPLAERVLDALREVKDPELGINIVDLGLVYDIELEEGSARVTMTLTSPGCPAGGQILSGAQQKAGSVEGVDAATVNLVWKPFWTPDRIDPKIRAALGY